jgi:hypothetical protein
VSVTVGEFIRDFPRFRAEAESGKTVLINSEDGARFIFHSLPGGASSGRTLTAPLRARLEEFRGLKNGWHDGAGIAPDKEKIDLVLERMAGQYPENLPAPAIVPTPEGNLLFEWQMEGDPSLDLKLADLKAHFHAFNSQKGDIEQEFNLGSNEAWLLLFSFLTDYFGAGRP